jgi:hypothetical protein
MKCIKTYKHQTHSMQENMIFYQSLCIYTMCLQKLDCYRVSTLSLKTSLLWSLLFLLSTLSPIFPLDPNYKIGLHELILFTASVLLLSQSDSIPLRLHSINGFPVLTTSWACYRITIKATSTTAFTEVWSSLIALQHE